MHVLQLELALRVGLSANFRRRLLRNNNFYRISQLDGRINDAPQRIGDDCRDLSSTASEIMAELLKPLLELGLFCVKLHALVGSGTAPPFLSRSLLPLGVAFMLAQKRTAYHSARP